MKEQFIAAHEELIAEFLDRHPGASDSAAYEATAGHAYGRMRDRLADRADYLRLKAKEGRE